jgi:hypothetical protein
MVPEEDPKEIVRFWGGWKGLYISVVLYGVLQIGLLYLFTFLFNGS